MSLFGKLVRTVVNVAELPLAAAKDAVTLGGISTSQDETYLRQLIEKLKEEAED